MKRLFKLQRASRCQIALAVACAGLAVSLIMVHFGGDLARHLPDAGFHLSAFIGAGLAGMLVADGLGHDGRRGWILSALWFIAATLIGAGVGAWTNGLIFTFFLNDWEWMEVRELLDGIPVLFGFGWLAVLDGVFTSLGVAAMWCAVLCAVHLVALRVRRIKRPIPSADIG